MRLNSELSNTQEKPDDPTRQILLQAMQMNMLRLQNRLSEFKVINGEYLQIAMTGNPIRIKIPAVQKAYYIGASNNIAMANVVSSSPSNQILPETQEKSLMVSAVQMPVSLGISPSVANPELKSTRRSTHSKKETGKTNEQNPIGKKSPKKIPDTSRQNAYHPRPHENNLAYSRNRMVLIPSSNVESFDSELDGTERIHHSIDENSGPKSQRTIHESQIVKNGKPGFQVSNKPRKTPRSISAKKPAPIEVLGSQIETSNEPASKNSLPILFRLNAPRITDIGLPSIVVRPPELEIDAMALQKKRVMRQLVEPYLHSKQMISQIIMLLSGKVDLCIRSKTEEELADIIFALIEGHKEEGFLSLIMGVQSVADQYLKSLTIAAECSADPYFQMAVVQHLLKHHRTAIKGEMLVILLRMVSKIIKTRRLKLVIAKYSNYLQ